MAVDYKNSLLRYRKYLQVVGHRPMWRATLFVSLSLLLLIILVIFAIRPTMITIAGLIGDIQTKENVMSQLDVKIANMQKMVVAYQSIQPEMYLLDTALPMGAQFSAVGKYLENAVQSAGTKADSLSFSNINLSSQTPVSQGLVDFEFSLSVTGSFSQIHDLLYKIERSRRLMTISDLQISKNSKGEMVANIKGQVFFILENHQP